MEPAREDQGGLPLAWARFTASTQEYQGVPYYWLGEGDLVVQFNVTPAAGHELWLLWGAKGDQRDAELLVNDSPFRLTAGGYDGFKWHRLVLPATNRSPYHLVLRPAQARPAFLAELRLVDPTKKGSPDLSTPLSKAVIHGAGATIRSARPQPSPFGSLRPFWDAEPAGARQKLLANAGELFSRAERNSRFASEGWFRCRQFVQGWLRTADSITGLIPENLGRGRDHWNGRNNAADNYPYMVLTCAFTDKPLFAGRMREMLRTESEVTRRLDRLGDWYQFSKRGFEFDTIDLDRLVFDNAEYVKDGLIPITEWLGPSPWSERMIGLLDDIWKQAAIDTPFGRLPTHNFEVNGDLLQACSRVYWLTGDRKYLEWAMRLGDYYLLGTNHPTRHMEKLSLGDHSCEVINGLSELYVILAQKLPDKRATYRAPLHELYDRILEIGVDERGMMYREVNTRTGVHGKALTDNWGYNYDGLYTAWLIDGETRYRDAVRKALSNVKHYSDYVWENGSADGYADSIEGAITLLNREFDPSAVEWVDSQIRVMWSKQQISGIIEGWHGDGNSARTTIMHALWKSQGTWVEPWREDVRVGAVREGDTVAIYLTSDRPWKGRLLFDRPRHRDYMRLPLDYPRINQFPEWFTVEATRKYAIQEFGTQSRAIRSGSELLAGEPVELKPGESRLWKVQPSAAQ